MLLIVHSVAKVAVVMNCGRPSNIETAISAVAHRMAFAIVTAGNCFLR
jgi:uncharacterized heparinase superfamily protein